MPHDAALLAETNAWLQKAQKDLAAAEYELKAGTLFADDVVFHAQQAAEKSMKAFLTWNGSEFRKTHNLVELGRSCVAHDPSLEGLLRSAASLTEYAWKFRYPGDPEEPSLQDAQQALATAQRVFEAVTARLPENVKPPFRGRGGTD